MVSKAGVALKGVTTFLRAIEFLGSALVLGITSYWLGGTQSLLTLPFFADNASSAYA